MRLLTVDFVSPDDLMEFDAPIECIELLAVVPLAEEGSAETALDLTLADDDALGCDESADIEANEDIADSDNLVPELDNDGTVLGSVVNVEPSPING